MIVVEVFENVQSSSHRSTIIGLNQNLQQAGRQASDQEPEPYNLRGHKFRETCVQFADGYSLSFNDNNLSAVHEFMWPLLQALQLNAVALQ